MDQQSNEFPGGARGVAASSAAKPRWQDRVGVGFWSLADQGTVSLGNFATTILLARAMSPRDFGVFALIFGMVLFLNNLHGALITYPLSVHGAAADDKELRRLTWLALALTLALALPIGIGASVIAWAFKLGRLTPWLIAAIVLWQVQETLRRGLMSHLRYHEAIWGDAVSYLGQALSIMFLAHSGRLSLPTIFGTIAGTSAIAALLQWAQLRLVGVPSLSGLMQRARDCWELGRWTAAGNLAGIANIQAVPWALAAFHGAAEAGKLVALGNILGVTHPAVFSIGNLIVPATARANLSGGAKSAWHTAVGYGAMGALLVAPYYLALELRPALALRIVYGVSSSYLGLATPLRLFTAAYSLAYVGMVLTALLNGLSRSRAALAIQLAMVATTILITLPLAMLGGVTWSLVGACASTLTGVIAGCALLRGSAGDRTEESIVTQGTAELSAAA